PFRSDLRLFVAIRRRAHHQTSRVPSSANRPGSSPALEYPEDPDDNSPVRPPGSSNQRRFSASQSTQRGGLVMTAADSRSMVLALRAWLDGDEGDRNADWLAAFVIEKAISGHFGLFKLLLD